ncbi:MAG: carbohydrate kinase [Spirochaetes bacterium]|nr:MAG: carbohydrate kinase [Spirochaetota bacterium]
MPDIVTIGEALIDFLSIDANVSLENTTGFTIAPGGAPANVAAAVSRLGESSGFIGKVGDDSFGRKIKNTLEEAGVDTENLIIDRNVNTTLAFIAIDENKKPDYNFYRNHCGADLALRYDEIEEGYIFDSKIFHFGSLSFTGEPLRSATLRSIEVARGSNKLISFDPNLRPSLWENLDDAKAEIINGLQYADIVKLTDEELVFITETPSITKGTDILLKYGPRAVIVTRGPKSCFYNNGDIFVELPSFTVKAVDTTGGGDAFVGGILVKFLGRIKDEKTLFSLEKEEIEDILKFAQACGAITVTRKGVIPALPTRDEVLKFLEKT